MNGGVKLVAIERPAGFLPAGVRGSLESGASVDEELLVLNRAQRPYQFGRGQSGRSSPNGASRLVLETSLNGDQYAQMPNGNGNGANGALAFSALNRRSNPVSDVMSRSSSSPSSSTTGLNHRNSHSPTTFQNHSSALHPSVHYPFPNSPRTMRSAVDSTEPLPQSAPVPAPVPVHYRTSSHSPSANNVLYRTWVSPPAHDEPYVGNGNGRPHMQSDSTNITLHLAQEMSSSMYSSGRSTAPSTSLALHRLTGVDGPPQIAPHSGRNCDNANSIPMSMPMPSSSGYQRTCTSTPSPILRTSTQITSGPPNGVGPVRFASCFGDANAQSRTHAIAMSPLLNQDSSTDRSCGAPNPSWTASLTRRSAKANDSPQLSAVSFRDVTVAQQPHYPLYLGPGNGALHTQQTPRGLALSSRRQEREEESAPDESIQKITLV